MSHLILNMLWILEKQLFLPQTKITQYIDMDMKIITFVTSCKIIDHGVGGVANNIGWDVFCGAY
jgi:hypothetical protein